MRTLGYNCRDGMEKDKLFKVIQVSCLSYCLENTKDLKEICMHVYFYESYRVDIKKIAYTLLKFG